MEKIPAIILKKKYVFISAIKILILGLTVLFYKILKEINICLYLDMRLQKKNSYLTNKNISNTLKQRKID